MFAIETELGRFEADTEREAKKALRAAMKTQAAIDARENEIHKQCRLLAGNQAYAIYDNIMRKESMPRGWRIKTVSTAAESVRMIPDDTASRGRAYVIDAEHGSATVRPYDAITHYLENGAGWCIAVAIANQDAELFAIGVSENRCYWVPLYGVAMSDFVNRE